jgi:hypothetical protein
MLSNDMLSSVMHSNDAQHLYVNMLQGLLHGTASLPDAMRCSQ